MRDYILSFAFITALLGGYTALVLSHNPAVELRTTASQTR